MTEPETDMSGITVVRFENSVHSDETYLSSELADGPPYTVHGVALGDGDVTKGKSGIKKKWPAEELRRAADSLQGTNLVQNHDNTISGVIGEVTKAGYKEGTGVIYEAELYDEDIAEKIDNGLLEVSVRGLHADVDSLETDDDTEALVVEDIEFKNLSIVSNGAAPSNTLQIGQHEQLSAAELAAFTESIGSEELQEIEPGMWVTWGDNHGITISQVEDGEVEVDIYEKQDGQWRSTEETKMVSTDKLDEWDVDEDDIGPVEDDEEKSEEENEPILDATSTEEMAAVGDKVTWQDGAAQGIVRERKTDGCFSEKIDGDHEICADEDEAVVLIEVVKDGETTGTMVAHKEDTLNEADFEMSTSMKDVPVEETPPEHDAMGNEMDSLVEQFEQQSSTEKPTLADFLDWLGQQHELAKNPYRQSPEDQDRPKRSIEGADEPLGHENALYHRLLDDPSYLRSEIEEKLEQSFDDYPEAAKENAQMALDAREETGNPKDCGTETGWRRANQLASGESLSPAVVKKMAQFNRHRDNSEMDDDEGRADCGWMMWKAWGGDEGVDWAKRKVKQEELAEIPEWSEGDEVKWQPMPTMQGKIVHVDEERQVLMVELMDTDGQMSGYTVTAGYTDVIPIDEEVPEPASDEGKEDEEEMSDEAKLQDWEMHEVTYDGTTEQEWNRPDLEDFVDEMDADATEFGDLTEDQQRSVASHFIISSSGFPPETYGDLALPIVEPSGELNVNALAAVKGGRGATAVDGLSSSMEEDIIEYVNGLANRKFDRNWGDDEEEMAKHGMKEDTDDDEESEQQGVPEAHRFESKEAAMDAAEEMGLDDVHKMTFDGQEMWVPGATHDEYTDAVASNAKHGDEMGEPTSPTKTVGGVRVLPGDDLREELSGESKSDSLTRYKVTTMNEELEAELSELDEPAAVEAEELEKLQEKADRFEELNENIEALRERTEILDEVDREQVEELSESDEPVVVESDRFEELQSEAEQVKGVYAAQLAEHYEAFDSDELADKFSIEELREKYEEQFGSIEELADSTEAEPRSTDPSEEELEEESGEDESEEELSDEVKQKQEEIRNKILGGD